MKKRTRNSFFTNSGNCRQGDNCRISGRKGETLPALPTSTCRSLPPCHWIPPHRRKCCWGGLGRRRAVESRVKNWRALERRKGAESVTTSVLDLGGKGGGGSVPPLPIATTHESVGRKLWSSGPNCAASGWLWKKGRETWETLHLGEAPPLEEVS